MTSGLELRGVSIRRDGADLVIDLGWTARAGTIVAITGSAGSGKSSLLAALAGRIAPIAGTLTLHGIPLGDARLQGRVGVVTQSHELVPTLTATENVALAALADETPPDDAWQHSRDLLDRLDLPASAQANLAEELSGGQHQRVAVARALAGDPALVLADDPTSELDASSTRHVLDALRDTAATGAIVVVSTNDSRVAAFAELIVHLDEHAVTQQNVPAHEPTVRSAVVRTAHVPRAKPEIFLPGQQIAAPGAAVPRGHCTAFRSRRARAGGATVLLPWDTTELAAHVGQDITVLRLDRRTGWALCRAADGTTGRVPIASLDIGQMFSVPSS